MVQRLKSLWNHPNCAGDKGQATNFVHIHKTRDRGWTNWLKCYSSGFISKYSARMNAVAIFKRLTLTGIIMPHVLHQVSNCMYDVADIKSLSWLWSNIFSPPHFGSIVPKDEIHFMQGLGGFKQHLNFVVIDTRQLLKIHNTRSVHKYIACWQHLPS